MAHNSSGICINGYQRDLSAEQQEGIENQAKFREERLKGTRACQQVCVIFAVYECVLNSKDAARET